MKKLLIVIATVLSSNAAFANNEDGSLVTRGTSRTYFTSVGGIPYVMPFVSDRTYNRIMHGNKRSNDKVR